ncbi:MAG: PrgI family protein [Candidatus Niyogibacteria bacterium]|nr:PrgI family protein [Candidatus Niyogibacteria bacterium]
MQFQVPQFTEIEDKIFGPLTLKQFLFVLAGGGISFIWWSLLPRWLAFIFIAPSAGFFLALAFYTVNGIPLLTVIANAIGFTSGAKLYTWQKVKKKQAADALPTTDDQRLTTSVPPLTAGKLKELSWSLDIQKKVR